MTRSRRRAIRLSLAAIALSLVGMGLTAIGLLMKRSDGPEVDGALVYAQRCAFCHDVEGQVGAEITASTLAVYGDEETLTRYLRLAMPYEAPGTMTAAEYRATANYLLETRGLAGASSVGGAASDESTTGEGR